MILMLPIMLIVLFAFLIAGVIKIISGGLNNIVNWVIGIAIFCFLIAYFPGFVILLFFILIVLVFYLMLFGGPKGGPGRGKDKYGNTYWK